VSYPSNHIFKIFEAKCCRNAEREKRKKEKEREMKSKKDERENIFV
jgi:hypothetical protein